SVARNQKYVSQKISNIIIESISNKNFDTDTDVLTSRENEVLQLIAEGNSSKEISELLFLSPKTVDVHRTNIMHKLNLFNISDLTKYDIKECVITLNKKGLFLKFHLKHSAC